MEPVKLLASALAIALTFTAFLPYIRSILAGRTRPHAFSWIVWGLTTLIVFAAQLAEKGGAGAWPTGVSAAVTFWVAALAARRHADMEVTRGDRLLLAAALSALPFWFFTADPTASVVILTGVDLAGFGPTLRRAWSHPQDERAGFYAQFTLRNALTLVALEHYSLATVLFPIAIGLACLLVAAVLWGRGRGARGAASPPTPGHDGGRGEG